MEGMAIQCSVRLEVSNLNHESPLKTLANFRWFFRVSGFHAVVLEPADLWNLGLKDDFQKLSA